MAEISKITLPSGNTYDIKDATAREMISGGVSFVIAWDGTSAPTVANIPAGVVVKYNGTNYTGTLTADSAEAGAFYLVKSSTTPSAETLDIYDEYVPVGVTGSKTWEKIGDTQLNLTDVVTDVSLSKQTDVVLGEGTTFTNGTSAVTFSGGTTDNVLGEATTFTNGTSSVSFGTHPTDEVLGSGTTFTTTVTPTTTNIKATASGGGTAWNSKDTVSVVTGYANPSTDTFVKSVTAETNKNLVTTTVPNVTDAGSASTWNFAMGSGNNAETLIISGANSTAPTLGTAKTVATGATATNGTGDAVVTGVTVGDSASAITALGTPTTDSVIGADATFTNTQPTVALATGATAGTGVINVATGITSASTTPVTTGTGSDVVSALTDVGTATAAAQTITVGTNDKVTAVTGIGTGTAAAQTITVGTNDKVTVLKNTTDVSVTKGNA